MKLIMTGGGDSQEFEEIDRHFIKLLGKKPKLLFIPLAGEKKFWRNGLKRITETFATIRFDQIEMCCDLTTLNWRYLKKFDAIYIDGGNTFQLMDKIRETHTFELLHRFLHNGGVINGDSAGAIVLGSHIETAHFGRHGDENEAGVISYQGLNLIGNWAIHCHYKKMDNKEVKRFVKEFGFPVLALHEETAVYIRDRRLKVIGRKPATVFTPEKAKLIKVGETFRL